MSGDSVDRCGIYPFSTDAEDPFNPLCTWHDQMYVLKEQGKQTLSRKEVDKRFLTAMLILSGDSKLMRAKAFIYYGLARMIGGPFWKWI